MMRIDFRIIIIMRYELFGIDQSQPSRSNRIQLKQLSSFLVALADPIIYVTQYEPSYEQGVSNYINYIGSMAHIFN